MANGPLGGFMPTPASPGQPPQVKLDTSAESRGNFNKFLGTLPKNGAIAPLQTGVMSSSVAPVSPIAGNVNIFQPQMSPMMAMAPMTMPMMPPAQPVQMMRTGGEASGEFSDTDALGGFDDFSSGFTEEEDPSRAGDFQTDESGIFTGSGSDDQPVVLPTPKPDILKEAVDRAEKEIFGGTESDALKFIDDQNNLTASGQKAYEDAIRGNLAELQDPAKPDAGGLQLASFFDNRGLLDGAKSTTAGDISRAAFAGVTPTRSIDTGAKGLESITDLGLDEIDPFDIQPTFQNIGLPGTSGLPNVRSTRSTVAQDQARAIANLVGPKQPTVGELLQQNILADRGRALGPITFADDLANFQERFTSSPPPDDFEENVGVPGVLRQGDQIRSAKDFEFTFTPKGIKDKEQRELRELRDIDEAIEVAERGPLTDEVVPGEDDIFEDRFGVRAKVPDAAKIFGGKKITNLPTGEEFEPPPIVAPGIEAPKEFTDPFPGAGVKVGSFTIPTLTSLANQFSQFSRGRVLDSIAQKGYTPVYDGDVIVGAKDRFGNLMEGIDPNAPMGSDDNQDPVRKLIQQTAKKEEEEKETPPNVIGGGVTPTPISQTPSTVVPSTFGPSTASFTPVGFNTGDLNDLIARITGISSPRRMQEGGIVNAVDNFLNKVA